MTSREPRPRSPYIAGPLYDWTLFLLPPLLALGVGVMVSRTAFTDAVFLFAGLETTAAQLALGTLIHAHLVAVLFRSHANVEIFRLHRARFVVVPAALWLAIVSSAWVAVSVTVVATFWDVWHSGAQTFGFARIYDRNAGVPPHIGRRLDLWMNQLLYAGPILAGATLMDHVDSFDSFEAVGSALFSSIPAHVASGRRYLTWAVLSVGSAFTAYYVWANVRLRRQGHRFSRLKIFLVASTGLCSIYTWGFNSWGEAFLIMNLFHAIQYLALVWVVEHRRMMGMLRVETWRRGKLVTASVYLGGVLAYGFGAQSLDPGLTTLWAITMVVSLMHFWYDGFVWSVVRRQV